MNKKNILLVISKFPPEYSGPGVRIPRLYKWLQEKNDLYNVKVLCNGIEQTKSARYEYQKLPVQRIVAGWCHRLFSTLPFVSKRFQHFIIYQVEFVQTLLSLYLQADYKNIDMVHLAGHSGGTVATLLWTKWYKIPVLMELVTERASYQQNYLFFGKAQVSKNSRVITLTEKVQQDCIRLGLKKNKIWCRPNPINDKLFKPEPDRKSEIRSSLTPFQENEIVISNVAKIIPQKNQLLILEALNYLPENFVAVIAGPFVKDGPLYERDLAYVSKMKELIAEYKLDNRVHLVLDFVVADQYMKLADIYAMPAQNEGFGTPMMEAMACGIPVVANKVEAAFREWIKNGENGYLCDVQNPQEWAQAIERAAKFTKEQCLDFSTDIRKKAGQEAIYNEYENIIAMLIKNDENNES